MPKRRAKRYARSVSALQASAESSDKSVTTQKRKVAKQPQNGEHHAPDVDEKTKRRRHLSSPVLQGSQNAAHCVDQEKAVPEKLEKFSREHSRPQSSKMVVDWNYDEDDCDCGPQKWPNFDGKQQSPIDLRLAKMKVINLEEPIQFINYDKKLNGEFVNTGHSGKSQKTLLISIF